MTSFLIDPKERILQAAVQLLQQEGHDFGQVSVRQIAALARVGVGLVNYHFGSKESLLNQAFLRILAQRAAAWLEPPQAAAGPALTRLKALCRQAGETAFAYPHLARIGIQHALLQGGFESAQIMLPLLREHYGPRKTELELRVLALALTAALGAAFLRLDGAAAFVGLDPRDPSHLAALVDLLIEQVLGEEVRRVGWKS
jgi:AcrR family transcriptional regulator